MNYATSSRDQSTAALYGRYFTTGSTGAGSANTSLARPDCVCARRPHSRQDTSRPKLWRNGRDRIAQRTGLTQLLFDDRYVAMIQTNGGTASLRTHCVRRISTCHHIAHLTHSILTSTNPLFRLDALAKALSVIATATWLAGWLAGCLSQPVLYQND